MTTSEVGVKFIKSWEKCRLDPYIDDAGLWTIGWGHLITDGNYTESISQETADNLFLSDLTLFESAVTRLVRVPLKQHEFDALVSFVFNVGVRAFRNSTMLKRINAGATVDDQFIRWVYVRKNGVLRESRGLRNRRLAERSIYLHGKYIFN